MDLGKIVDLGKDFIDNGGEKVFTICYVLLIVIALFRLLRVVVRRRLTSGEEWIHCGILGLVIFIVYICLIVLVPENYRVFSVFVWAWWLFAAALIETILLLIDSIITLVWLSGRLIKKSKLT